MCGMFTVVVETLGCRLNQTESEGLAVIFAKAGFKVLSREQLELERISRIKLDKCTLSLKQQECTNMLDVPLLCIINTCTVTSKAEQKARRLIRLLLKKCTQAIVLVTGCYAQLDAEKIEAMDERVLTFQGKKKDALIYLPQYLIEHCAFGFPSTSCNVMHFSSDERVTSMSIKAVLLSFKAEYEDRHAIDKKYDTCMSEKIGEVHHKISTEFLLDKSTQDERKQVNLSLSKDIMHSRFIPLFALSCTSSFMFHSRATLKVQDGCNNACSFCRIRLARGKAISLPVEEAIKRIRMMEAEGAVEVVITGVNLSQYEDSLHDFSYLLESLLLATTRIRIRISSLYPESITPSFLSVASDKRVCPHFHLSIQSGSDRILTKMGRRYTRQVVYEAVHNLRKHKRLPFIGCDIIAGFPSESEEDFLLTVKMCQELQFAGIHAFPFSPRPGTLALVMKGKVSERISGERVSVLNDIAKKNYKEYLTFFEGETLFGVVEGDGKSLFITTENYLQLPLKTKNEHKAGEGIYVCIVGNEAVEV